MESMADGKEKEKRQTAEQEEKRRAQAEEEKRRAREEEAARQLQLPGTHEPTFNSP